LAIPEEERARRIAAHEAHPDCHAEAARELGINVSTYKTWLQSEGLGRKYVVTGRSTLTNLATGEKLLEWEKTSLDREAEERAREAAFRALSEKLPRVKATPKPTHCNAALATLYTLTDCHVGALCWHKEGGADWDLAISEKTLLGCFNSMISAAPRSEVGIINQLGDFLHWDGLLAVTPTSGHHLDADGRFDKLVETSIRILRAVVDLALVKHERVHVILAEGNHDIASSVWLRKMFKALYEDEPRVTVDDSALPYYAFQHGRTMLAFHHGHLKKNDQLPILFAAQFSRMWGDTTKRYCHTGHRHHVEEREHSGMIVTQHPTLAARDAYAARGGWVSERSATAITYHSEFGQVVRVTVTPEMLEAAA